MSDELLLSDEMVADVKAAIAKHDARANDDIIAVQYAAAVMGYMLGEIDLPQERRQDIFNQLGGFAADIMRQVEQRNAPPAPPAQDAFGIWKPKK
ncbi:MAG: hypothetical protein ACWA5X_03895 [bacterium]